MCICVLSCTCSSLTTTFPIEDPQHLMGFHSPCEEKPESSSLAALLEQPGSSRFHPCTQVSLARMCPPSAQAEAPLQHRPSILQEQAAACRQLTPECSASRAQLVHLRFGPGAATPPNCGGTRPTSHGWCLGGGLGRTGKIAQAAGPPPQRQPRSTCISRSQMQKGHRRRVQNHVRQCKACKSPLSESR